MNIKLLNQPVKNIKNREKKEEDQEAEMKLSPCFEPSLLSTVLQALHLVMGASEGTYNAHVCVCVCEIPKYVLTLPQIPLLPLFLPLAHCSLMLLGY